MVSRILRSFILSIVAVRQEYSYYIKHIFIFQEGGGIFMEQTATMEPVISTFTKGNRSGTSQGTFQGMSG